MRYIVVVVLQIVAAVSCAAQGPATRAYVSALGNQTYVIEARAVDENDEDIEVTYGMVMARAHRRADKLCQFGYVVLDTKDGSRTSTVTESRAGGGRIGGAIIVRERSETTTTTKPRYIFVVQCRIPKQYNLSRPGDDPLLDGRE